MRYTVLIDGEDGAFGVVFPDCPGCVAMGDTVEEALLNAQVALQDWAAAMVDAGEKLPPARDPAAMRRDPEVMAALARGDALATVALVPVAGKSTRINVSMDAGTLAFIDAEAKRQGMTRSGFLERAARDFAARS